MCGLFGFSSYGKNSIKNLNVLTNSLAEQAAERGTDATGIAFCMSGKVNILKEPKSAYKINFKHSDKVSALVGHTRHATQGDVKLNYNNHPFPGRVKGRTFALAHNGVLMNDEELRKSLRLPKTKIKTDSYIAVQLIESKKTLNADSIKYMAEKVNGSFSFSIIDDTNNIYLVKGDSPLSIIHFPRLKIYVYASTEEILWRSLIDSPLFDEVKSGEFSEVKITEGDILKICSDGNLVYDKFEYTHYMGRSWWDYGWRGSISEFEENSYSYSRDEYIEDLKCIASLNGYPPEDVDMLLDNGFTLCEIEEYLYEY